MLIQIGNSNRASKDNATTAAMIRRKPFVNEDGSIAPRLSTETITPNVVKIALLTFCVCALFCLSVVQLPRNPTKIIFLDNNDSFFFYLSFPAQKPFTSVYGSVERDEETEAKKEQMGSPNFQETIQIRSVGPWVNTKCEREKSQKLAQPEVISFFTIFSAGAIDCARCCLSLFPGGREAQ